MTRIDSARAAVRSSSGDASSGVRRPARTRWPAALVLVGAGASVALQVGKAVAALPALRADLGLSLTTGGWVLSSVNLAGGMAGLLIGAGADRLGHRRSVLTGMALVVTCSVLGAAAPSAALLLATRFGEGLGLVLTVLAVPGLLLRVTSARDHGVMFGIWGAYMSVGTALAVVGTPPLLHHGGWRGLWLATAAAAALWMVPAAVVSRDLRTSGPRPGRPGVGRVAVSVLRVPGPPLLAGIFAAYTAQYLAVVGFLPTLLIDQYRIPPGSVAALTALVALLNAPGNLLGGWLGRRGVSRRAVLTTASVVMGVVGTGIYLPGIPLAGHLACTALLTFAGGTIPATVLGAAPDLAPGPHAVAATNGLAQQGALLGSLAGPPLVAAVATAVGGWTMTPAVLGAAAGLAVVLAALLPTSHHPAHRGRPHPRPTCR